MIKMVPYIQRLHVLDRLVLLPLGPKVGILVGFVLGGLYTGLDNLAHAHLLMVGNFHGGQVKFDKYQPGWQALFPKSQADHCLGRLKIILG